MASCAAHVGGPEEGRCGRAACGAGVEVGTIGAQGHRR
jgi:hypothetical protein